MKKPHEIKGASLPFIIDLAAYSMIYPDRTSIRFESSSSPDPDGIEFPTEEAAAAEFARIRAALLGEPTPSGLPPLPAGEEWHNPENISPSLLEEGYRFMTKREFENGLQVSRVRAYQNCDNGKWFWPSVRILPQDWTYAVPLNTWPLPRP